MVQLRLNNLLLIISAVILLLLTRCEKIIDVDLNDAGPTLVIEGNLSLNDSTVKVKLSETGSYFGNGQLQKISGAIVSLEDSEGNVFSIEEKEKGLYIYDMISAVPGNSYKLSVRYNDMLYSAVSFLNPKVRIDSVGYEKYEKTRFYEEWYRINLFFEDPPGKENYYRINLYKNGKLMSTGVNLIVFDDSGLDGKFIHVRLRDQRFSKNDRVYIEMMAIDKPVWKYFSTLRDVADLNPGSPAPANPISNFNNGALGYFSAWSCDTKFIIIK